MQRYESDHWGGMLEDAKASLNPHIKMYYFDYQRLMKLEIAYIDRITEVKLQILAVIGSGIIALLIGVANFLSSWAFRVATANGWI